MGDDEDPLKYAQELVQSITGATPGLSKHFDAMKGTSP